MIRILFLVLCLFAFTTKEEQAFARVKVDRVCVCQQVNCWEPDGHYNNRKHYRPYCRIMVHTPNRQTIPSRKYLFPHPVGNRNVNPSDLNCYSVPSSSFQAPPINYCGNMMKFLEGFCTEWKPTETVSMDAISECRFEIKRMK